MMTTDNEAARRRTRAELATRIFLVTILLLATTSLVLISSVTISDQQRRQESRETLATIKSCVEPTGACYRDGQRRTAGAVSSINQVIVLAAACSVGLPPGLTVTTREAAIERCVHHRLVAATQKQR